MIESSQVETRRRSPTMNRCGSWRTSRAISTGTACPELGFGAGGAERAVADMNDRERVELQRLLTEALGGGV